MVFARLARPFFLSLALLIAAPADSFAAPLKSKPATGTAGIFKGYIVTDAATGQVLLQENPDAVSPPASMTKLMTFLLVDDAIKAGALTLQTPVAITVEDSKMGGTQVHLDPRETFPIEELLYALMIQSANDAAHALARTTAGTRDLFVERMNTRAQALGMTRTRFTSPHGLPPGSRQLKDSDLTSPADFAILCREVITKTDILRYSSIKKRTFGADTRDKPTEMENHNKLLGKVAGVDGLKTGYTQSAGYCLSATAERGGRRLIVVIMGSFGTGGLIDKGVARDLKTIELIERGFAAFPKASTASSPAVATPAQAPVNPSPISPVTPATNGPVRSNLSSPKRPAEPAPTPPPSSPVSSAPSETTPEKSPPPAAQPTVKFTPAPAPRPTKSTTR